MWKLTNTNVELLDVTGSSPAMGILEFTSIIVNLVRQLGMKDGNVDTNKKTVTEMTEFLTLRPEVQEFAQAIEARLRKNDDKDGWEDMSFQECLDREVEEAEELFKELDKKEHTRLDRVRHEIEDRVNFLLFAWHNADQEFE